MEQSLTMYIVSQLEINLSLQFEEGEALDQMIKELSKVEMPILNLISESS